MKHSAQAWPWASSSAALRGMAWLLAGCAVGAVAWGQGPRIECLLAVLVLPLAWNRARTRLEAALLMLGYFYAGSRSLPTAAVVFFGEDAPAGLGLAMWAFVGAALSLPFVALWPRHGRGLGWRYVLALCICSAPPLAFIGWLSPVSVAGCLFPGWGWAGLALALAMTGALAATRRRDTVVLVLLAGLANIVSHEVSAPARWQGMDTAFARLSSAGADDAGQLLASMRRIEWVRQLADQVPVHSVVVLPETILGNFDGVAEATLSEAEASLRARGSRILVGAELPQDNGRYKNVVLALGAEPGESRMAVQSVPVPVAMWRPWTPDGAEADIWARGNTFTVNGKHAGAVVCYEQLLSYSLLRLMATRPDVLVAVSNAWWARATNVPWIQYQSVHAFGRLFAVPVITARNI